MAMFLQVILNRCGNGRFRGSSSRFSCGKLSKTYLIAVHLSKLPTAMFHISSESGDSDVELVSCQPRVFHNSCSPTEEPTEETSPFVSNEWSTSTTNRPILLILVGIPGSGKSSFAKKLEAKGWIRVCQDELLTRKQCENYAINSLLEGKPTVIDRCNVTREQRAIWIDIGKNLKAIIGCLVFTTPLDICVSRVAQRSEHPNLKGSDSESVIFQFAKEFCAPTAEEGIDFCRRIQTEQDEQRILQQLSLLLNSSPPFTHVSLSGDHSNEAS